MSKRSTRINYKNFNSSGERVPVEEPEFLSRLQNLSINEQPSTEMTEPSEDAIDIIVLAQEAMDIAMDMMQEVPINNLSSDDTNIVITKLEQIRSYIRRKETIIKFRKTSIRDFIATSYDRKSPVSYTHLTLPTKA